MKIKILYFLLLFCLSLSFVFCEERQHPTSFSFVMPYIGGKGGVIQSQNHHKSSSSTQVKSQDEGLLGGIGGVYAGFGGRWKDFYIGPYGDFMWSGASETLRVSNGEYTKEDINMFTSIRAKLGYYIGEKALLYIDSGYAWNQFRKDHTRANNAGGYSFTKWLGGPILGVGTDLFILPSIGINLDFLFVWTDSYKYNSTNEVTGVYESLQDTNRISIFTVGLFYQF